MKNETIKSNTLEGFQTSVFNIYVMNVKRIEKRGRFFFLINEKRGRLNGLVVNYLHAMIFLIVLRAVGICD